MKKRYSEEQIIGFPQEADAGLTVKDLCRRHGFSEASYYLWRSKFGGMNVPDASPKDLIIYANDHYCLYRSSFWPMHEDTNDPSNSG